MHIYVNNIYIYIYIYKANSDYLYLDKEINLIKPLKMFVLGGYTERKLWNK